MVIKSKNVTSMIMPFKRMSLQQPLVEASNHKVNISILDIGESSSSIRSSNEFGGLEIVGSMRIMGIM